MSTNKKKSTRCWMLALLLAFMGLALISTPTWACGGGVLCVDADATGAATGLSWTDAYTSVQDALAVTNANGATDYEIWVAEGVYYPDKGANTIADSPTMSFTVRYDNVQLYGGFAATETQRTERDWAAHITVLSGDIGQDDTTDANHVVTHTDNISGSNAYHVLWLDGVTHEPISTTTVIDGFTITAGQANSDTSPDNYNWGGGLYCDGAGSGSACSPDLTNVIFSGNWADGNGGGMFNDGSDSDTSGPSLTNVTFSGNQAGEWGGGMFTAGNPTLTGVTFSDNRAVDYGGGMCNAGSPVLTDVTFSDNRAVHWGGGMSNLSYDSISSPTLVNVIFSGNQADIGGGMFNNAVLGGASSPVLTNVTFSGNQADRGGGMSNWGLFSGTSSPVLTNVTFSGNQADAGGGMYNLASDGGASSPSLANTILWGNDALTGTQIYNDAATLSGSYSLVEGGIGGAGIYNTNGGSVTDDGGNLDADPRFVAPPDPGGDGTWGTSDDDYGDLRLSCRSPAIDAGNSLSVTTGTDLAGNPRIMGAAVDMGAYEVEKNTLTVSGADAETWLDFGPEVCARIWFTNTGTLPTSVAITLTHETPSVNADGLPRRYEIVPTGGSNYAARLELCYADDELPQAGIAPSEEPNLHAYCYAGSPTWVEYSTVDPVNNTVTAHSVTDFGLWGLGIDSNQPTAVKMTALAAQPGRWPWLTATLLLGGMSLIAYFERRRRH